MTHRSTFNQHQDNQNQDDGIEAFSFGGPQNIVRIKNTASVEHQPVIKAATFDDLVENQITISAGLVGLAAKHKNNKQKGK